MIMQRTVGNTFFGAGVFHRLWQILEKVSVGGKLIPRIVQECKLPHELFISLIYRPLYHSQHHSPDQVSIRQKYARWWSLRANRLLNDIYRVNVLLELAAFDELLYLDQSHRRNAKRINHTDLLKLRHLMLSVHKH